MCPGISGYCSEGYLGQQCSFPCPRGPAIDSVCTIDGTWDPYPTCLGDVRQVPFQIFFQLPFIYRARLKGGPQVW